MRAAIIRDGIVENIIIASEDFDPGNGSLVIPIGDEPVNIGATWDGQNFTNPPPAVDPVPEAVTARQARLALLGAGLLATVEQALASMPGVQGEAARIEWEYALAIERDSALIAALAPALGLTEEQIDDLFRAAGGL